MGHGRSDRGLDKRLRYLAVNAIKRKHIFGRDSWTCPEAARIMDFTNDEPPIQNDKGTGARKDKRKAANTKGTKTTKGKGGKGAKTKTTKADKTKKPKTK